MGGPKRLSPETAAYRPDTGIFAPTTGLDHRLFGENFELRPQVREVIMERLDRCIRVDIQLAGSDWQEWLKVYIAGGSASEWAGGRPDSDAQDLDVLVGLDLAKAQGYNSFEGMDEDQAATALNAAFRKCFNHRGWQAPFGGTWDLTAYCNPRIGTDIRAIKPYAAWDLTDSRWAVKPPHLPDHTLADFDPAVLAHARAVLAEARAILRLPEPLRTREARALWEHIHEHRCQAFSENGRGWTDPGNVDEKYVQYAPGHVLDRIKALVFPEDRPLAATAAARDSGDTRCVDCGAIVSHAKWAPGKQYEHYIVHQPLWEQAGSPNGYLCIGCLENRLGRELNKRDFPEGVPVNSLGPENDRYAWSDRTPRLRDRLTREACAPGNVLRRVRELALAGQQPKTAVRTYHGSPHLLQGAPRIPETSEDDREYGRLAGFYTSTDPLDAGQFGDHVSEHQVNLSNPLHVRYSGDGDPGAEVWEKLTGEKYPPEGADIAARVRAAGHDGVIVHVTPHHAWHVALEPSALGCVEQQPKTAAKDEKPTRTKEQVSYREGTAAKHCGNCVMIRLAPPDFETHKCTLVKGIVEPTAVCDEWYPAKGSKKEAVSGYEGLTGRSGMIYLEIPEGLIGEVPGGVDDHHITLVYLGKNVSDEAFGEACQRAAKAAAAHHPLEGVLHGIDTFPASDSSDGKVPAFVPAYIPGIGKLRQELEDLSASEHPHYRPHLTLGYYGEDEELPPPHPPVRIRFTHLHVKRGDEVRSYPLGEPIRAQAELGKQPTPETWKARYDRVDRFLERRGDGTMPIRDRWGPHTPDYVAHGLIADHDGPVRDEHWEHLPDEYVSLKQPIHTHQGYVYPATVRHYLHADNDPDAYPDGGEYVPGGDEPKIVRHKGQHYLLDGHHRYVKDRLMGHDSMMAKVFDTANPEHKQSNCYECHEEEARDDYDHDSDECPACRQHGWQVW